MEMVYKAIKFAEKKHEGQVRKKSGAPYITHPIMTSYILTRFKRSSHFEELVCAALLHDTLEDTDTNFIEIAKEFTPLVASLVLELTSDDGEIERLGKNEYFKKKLPGLSNYGLLLKLCDRLANVMDNPKPQYILDTIELMESLSYSRVLTGSQLNLIDEIKKECKKKS